MSAIAVDWLEDRPRASPRRLTSPAMINGPPELDLEGNSGSCDALRVLL